MVETNIVPMNKRVIVREAPKETKTKMGIVLPERAQERPSEGTVVASASELVKPEQIIIYSKYAGTRIKDGEQEFVLIHENDILGVRKDG